MGGTHSGYTWISYFSFYVTWIVTLLKQIESKCWNVLGLFENLTTIFACFSKRIPIFDGEIWIPWKISMPNKESNSSFCVRKIALVWIKPSSMGGMLFSTFIRWLVYLCWHGDYDERESTHTLALIIKLLKCMANWRCTSHHSLVQCVFCMDISDISRLFPFKFIGIRFTPNSNTLHIFIVFKYGMKALKSHEPLRSQEFIKSFMYSYFRCDVCDFFSLVES